MSNHNKNGSHKYMYQHTPFSLSGEHALSRVNRKRQLSLESMLEFGKTEAVGAERDASAPARKSLKSEDRQRAAQAHFYIYSTQVISKETLRDPMFIKLMQVMGTCKRTHRDEVEAEYAVFQQYLALVMARKIEMSRGAAFAQIVHDGGTLRNHWKHQALAASSSSTRSGRRTSSFALASSPASTARRRPWPTSCAISCARKTWTLGR